MAEVELTRGARPAGTAFPAYGIAGLVLLAVAWGVSWSHVRPFSDLGFFPLWFGYIVLVDAAVCARSGDSLLRTGFIPVLRVFAVSAAMWWLFELINLRTDNWHYLRAAPIGPVRDAIESSVDFSTVLPAVFETAALVGLLLPGRGGDAVAPGLLPTALRRAALALGVVCLVLPLAWPRYFFPMVWLGLFFVADSVNAGMGRDSLLAGARAGRWRRVLVLGLAGLCCGFLWEMWNSHSMPKWTYSVPLIPQQRLFEMPLLGYSGYIPFAFECFAIYTLVAALWERQRRA